jgi:hypothetical protein
MHSVLCSANHFEAQIYYREVHGHGRTGKSKGRKESVGTFLFDPAKEGDMVLAAEKAARAADRANVMFHELKHTSREHIQKRLNVRLLLDLLDVLDQEVLLSHILVVLFVLFF